ncbi:MAG: DNA polymerase I [Acutalibacteraceae bacterium]|nr:DNA polymerase I [Acutalibacteraceae bacterium]
MKLLAIDGNSIINRAFYGIRLLSTSKGVHTNAVYGFINILNKLVAQENPDGVAVAFDLKIPTFRHEKYDEYKAGRKPMPEELREQIPLLKEWLTLFGYKVIECPRYEADDILGTLARICEDSKNTCVIATGDRDSLQLISENVKVLLSATKAGKPEIVTFDKEALMDKYGLTPPQMIELKALMGDASDHIPGVSGIGEKTATELIINFGSLDGVYENLDSPLIRPAVKTKLEAGKGSAYLSHFLGTISRQAPISENLKDYLPCDRDENALAAFMTELELFRLMDSMGISPVQSQESIDFAQSRVISAVESKDFVMGDTLDIACDFSENKIAVVSGENACVFSAEDTSLTSILSSDRNKRVYNCKELYRFCIEKNIELKNVTFDAMVAGYLADPSSSSYDIDRLIGRYHIADTDMTPSVLRTAVLHGPVCDALKEELIKTGQDRLLTEIELPLSEVLASMELTGVLVDRDGLLKMGDELSARIDALQKEIYSLIGYELNLNSPKQLGIALFEDLKLPGAKKTKSGYSTSAEILENLKYEHPAVEKLLTYRQLTKLKSTYCDGLYSAAGEDGRIHSTFNQVETRTGRISSLEPNLQNIPVRSNEGKKLRKFFVAEEGMVLCDADYSQIELRVLASIAKDENMIAAFKSGLDIHTATAAQVFSLPSDMVTPSLRSKAKAVNFGIVYGIGAFSLSKDIGVSRKEADQYIKGYLTAYKGVDGYMKRVIEEAKENGFVTTIFGRRRYLPELSSSNHMLRSFGERVARNAPIQGSAADIIKIAMIKVYNRLKAEVSDARLILQVHDELIVECKEQDANTVCNILQEEMRSAADMAVELIADANIGKSWYDAKG